MPTYLLWGPNTYTSTQKRRQIVDRYRQRHGATNCGTFYGSDLRVDQYRDLILTLPLLASSRLAVMIDALTEAKLPIKAYIEKTLPDIPASTIVIFHETQPVDRRSLLFKKLNQPKQSQAFPDWDRPTTASWARGWVKNQGGELALAEARYLIERIGLSPWLIEQELKKLLLYCPSITRQSIDRLTPATSGQSVFAIMEAIRRRQIDYFLAVGDQLLSQGESVPRLVSLIQAALRQLILCLAASPSLSDWQLAGQLRLPVPVIKSIKQHQRWNQGELQRAYRELVILDWDIKTGKIEEEIALDRLAIRLLSPT